MTAPPMSLIRQVELFPESSVYHSEHALRQHHEETAAANDGNKKNGAPVKDLTGQRFGALVVESLTTERHHGGVVFLCRCDCGRAIKATGRHLQRKDNPVNHCGCKGAYKNLKYAPGTRGIGGWSMGKRVKAHALVAFNALYAAYRNGATKRGYQWNLSRERFLELSTSDCHYCGAEPSQVYVREPHQFVYNGIDRVDSNQGYHQDNCVACCGQCNKAKMDHDASDFLAWVDRVYHHQHRHDQTP